MDKKFKMLDDLYKSIKIFQLLREVMDELLPAEVLNELLDDVMQSNGGKSPDDKFDQFLERIRREKKKLDVKNYDILTDNILQEYEQQMNKESENN